jgi:GNAT superfamily N-acetyltransferase
MLDEADYNEETGRQLMTAAGELAVCVGWLAYDADDQGLSRELYSEARLLADQSGDDGLATCAMEKMSLQSARFAQEGGPPGSAREAVRLSEEPSYVDAIASGDPFDSIDVFMHRFDSYASQSNFDLVIAYHGDEAIGQTWGWPLAEHSRWWDGLIPEPEPDFIHENGRRTFVLSEIMVSQEWTGKGVAHALHDRLLSVRPEVRASLLVEPENTRAYRAYLHWGWRKIGQLRPGWNDAPTFDVLLLTLDTRDH